MYNNLIDTINENRKKIYGDMWAKKRALDEDIALLTKKIASTEQNMKGKKDTDTLTYNVLKRRKVRLEESKKNRIELMNSDDWWRGKVMPKRGDYYRHFREISDGIQGLLNAFETPSGIDPKLAGISEFTKPKSKYAGIFQKRTGEDTERDAVGGFLNYIPAATYAIYIDPVIMKVRELSSGLATATEETKNLNNFIEYLQDYANDLAGKTNPADRYFQKIR